MSADYSQGAAYVDGKYMPLSEAAVPVTDWGYRRSDVTYDVVTVWAGMFFRLDEHIARFRRSMQQLRLNPKETDEEIREILIECVRLSGLRESYVAMDCLRGRTIPGKPSHPASARNYLICFARPYAYLISKDVQERGATFITARTPRIPAESVDPTVKNFHWGDLTRGSFEAYDAGADGCVLLDFDGNVTEGPGYNVFMVRDGEVHTPDRGALEGITRQTVFDLCKDIAVPCTARQIHGDELQGADEIFVTSSGGGVMPVRRIDGHVMSNDAPGPLSAKLKSLYWKKREEGWLGTPVDYGTR